MLYESKSHWEKTPGSIYHLDFGDHIFLVKNSEGFIIEKKTFELTNSGELENSKITYQLILNYQILGKYLRNLPQKIKS